MDKVFGIIFCGGKATRLGGVSKPSIEIGGTTLLSRTAAHLRGAVDQIALSVKADTPLPDNHGFDIIYDMQDESVATALLSALKFAKDAGYDCILTLPVDTPFLPENYAGAMLAAGQDVQCAYAEHGGHIHGLHSLWKTSAYDDLYTQIYIDKSYRISSLYRKNLSTACEFTDVDKSMFLNINTPENLALAQKVSRAATA